MSATIRLREPASCDGCGRQMRRGWRVHRDPSSKALRCLDCGASTGTVGAAGASAQQQAGQATDHAERLERRTAAAERRAAAFAAGAEGERIVADALAPLSAEGHIVLHDRATSGSANLDHLVISPSGVWLVNAKHWTGELTVTDTLRRNGRSCRSKLERAATERDLVHDALSAAGVSAPVRAVFAFTAAAPPRTTITQTELVPVDDLRDLIAGRPAVVDPATADRAAAALMAAFPRAGTTPTPPVEDDAIPDDLRDDDGYVFVEPWSKRGQNRLYVHRCGLDFGYVDLTDRTIHPKGEHVRLQATMELVLEWFADAGAEPAQVGRVGRIARWYRQGGLRRRVVAVRFRRGSVDRLYVHLCDGASREQIGFYDRTRGTVHADKPEFVAVIAKSAALHPNIS